ncbi:alpha/beta hydrolase [Planococcus sp. CP5-4]|uniref:lipase family alpha/beta hydrolase n=1 Tax=unclassified Planococcus (in: firmicutes) TaxID=2662419 RepID=UPI001C21C897|nr:MULTISPECIES: alpha/beta fold hydrolase [unclassified Planococcus (in: firmicutes)]MBU9675205.1 alpha/beta hydrolase [Planococcus sp. CP5-4_YE]MBV0909974.1 alpha/beta hydrolase [Planococcus sp. CP5-4_UN]MBW6065482.1 alpha/beta hydrolase [Planococcus sp. CP5-4]
MENESIYSSQNRIIIDTTLEDIHNTSRKIMFFNEQLTVEKVVLANSKINNPPHSENKMVFRIELNEKMREELFEKKSISFRLRCEKDEYFYTIQEEYLELIDHQKVDNMDLLNILSPRVELLNHENSGDKKDAIVNNSQIKYLLNQSKAENKKFLNYISNKHPELYLKYTFSPTDSKLNSFLLILNKFNDKDLPETLNGDYKSSGESKVYTFNKNKFFEIVSENEVVIKKESQDKKIAFIVHGLASQIGGKYIDLARFLSSKGYKVYGFDYHTVNQGISDNGYLLAKEIKKIKKFHPKSEVLIVAHSMGGLVSRSAKIEYFAEVDKIIMAGTPNGGSKILHKSHRFKSIRNKIFVAVNFVDFLSIKRDDLYGLMYDKDPKGIKDLANKSSFISDLNKKDTQHFSQKYFSLVGRFMNMSNDIIVSNDNMTSINGINMSFATLKSSHFSYFTGKEWSSILNKALIYLK